MSTWVSLLAGFGVAALGWATAFGMLRAQVQGLRRDLDKLENRLAHTEEMQIQVLDRISHLAADTAVLAALANAAEALHRRGV